MYKTLSRNIEALRAEAGGAVDGIGVVGFSMGGHWAVWLSQRPEFNVSATVLYYAARGGRFAQSVSTYLAHYADDDPWVSQNARRGMERAINRAGCRYRAFEYPGTKHWFAECDRPSEYDRSAASLALKRSKRYLRKRLMP